MGGQNRDEDIVYHKMRAQACINSNLKNETLRLSDATIGAVFNLLCVGETLLHPKLSDEQQRNADAVERVVHLNGLKRMIALRGGLLGLSSHCLRAHILW